MEDIKMCILVNKDIEMNDKEIATQVSNVSEKMLYNQFKKINTIIPSTENYMRNLQRKTILYCSQSKLEELESNGYISSRGKLKSGHLSNTITCVNIGFYSEGRDFTEELDFINNLKSI